MKGLSLKYLVSAAIFPFVLLVSMLVIKHFHSQLRAPQASMRINMSYTCVQLNNSELGLQEFHDILYAFLTGQCGDFYGKLKITITKMDLERMVHDIDPSVRVILLRECKLPAVNSHSVYINFTEIFEGGKIYLHNKKIINSDVLICG